jgi:hypothetical protein
MGRWQSDLREVFEPSMRLSGLIGDDDRFDRRLDLMERPTG